MSRFSLVFSAQSELLIWCLLYSNRYLDSVINLAYTLLRMLEKYSKSKAYMYVRKKRAGRAANARKKKRESDLLSFGQTPLLKAPRVL